MKVTFFSLAYLTALGLSFSSPSSAGIISLELGGGEYDDATNIVTFPQYSNRSIKVQETQSHDDANLKTIRTIFNTEQTFEKVFETSYKFQSDSVIRGKVIDGFTTCEKVARYRKADDTDYDKPLEKYFEKTEIQEVMKTGIYCHSEKNIFSQWKQKVEHTLQEAEEKQKVTTVFRKDTVDGTPYLFSEVKDPTTFRVFIGNRYPTSKKPGEKCPGSASLTAIKLRNIRLKNHLFDTP